MKTRTRWFLGIALISFLSSGADALARRQTRIRWDICAFNATTFILDEGGKASALSPSPPVGDGSKITLTGFGFLGIGRGHSNDLTATGERGGGTWETFDSTGRRTGSGTYEVIEGSAALFQQTPGDIPSPPVIDRIGDPSDGRSGLMVAQIRYNDGDLGILAIMCADPLNAPPPNFDGITVTKGFIQRWVAVPLVVSENSENCTQFHVVRERGED